MREVRVEYGQSVDDIGRLQVRENHPCPLFASLLMQKECEKGTCHGRALKRVANVRIGAQCRMGRIVLFTRFAAETDGDGKKVSFA